jgi:hypothetical protein
MMPSKYYSWRFWVRWFVPLPILIWYSKRNFFSHVWYSDPNFQLELSRKYASPHKVDEALREALRWNEEYKRINHLSGNPYWVHMAQLALGEQRTSEIAGHEKPR